jgi:hypothetical protein
MQMETSRLTCFRRSYVVSALHRHHPSSACPTVGTCTVFVSQRQQAWQQSRRPFPLSIVSRTHYTDLLAGKDGHPPIIMSKNFVDDERFDGMYLNIADTARGIEPLLDTVFSFCKSFVSLTECHSLFWAVAVISKHDNIRRNSWIDRTEQ